jgi:Type II secretion system (T2SS), protein G
MSEPGMTAPHAQPKASWPLIALAVLSFIPGFGFFFAALTITWALLSDRPRARLALILAAAGGLLTIAEGGALLYYGSHSPEFQQARVEMAQQDLERVVAALERYHAAKGEYPEELTIAFSRIEPARFVNVIDRSHSLFNQTPYQYTLAADGTYNLFAVGPDGLPGTADDIRPHLPDSVAVHSGYRAR